MDLMQRAELVLAFDLGKSKSMILKEFDSKKDPSHYDYVQRQRLQFSYQPLAKMVHFKGR